MILIADRFKWTIEHIRQMDVDDVDKVWQMMSVEQNEAGIRAKAQQKAIDKNNKVKR